MDQAVKHCEAGLGIWQWASNDQGGEPDVVMACCGDVPTLETLAAVDLLRKHAPDLKVRVINVVNLMKLQPSPEHPHGLSNRDFDAFFTTHHLCVPWIPVADSPADLPTHEPPQYPCARLKEQGTTTTPFDMCVLNDLDRFHLVSDVIDRVPKLEPPAAYAKQAIRDKLIDHKRYIARYGDDMPEITGWRWGQEAASAVVRSTAADNV